MKTQLIPLLAGCAALLPFSGLQAADVAGRTYGGFLPGKVFTLTVTERSSIRTSGISVTKHVAIPDGMPDFNKGQDVKFKIGRYGRLNGPGFSITYRSSKSRVNFYSNNPGGFSSDGEAATVSKNSNNKPIGATLTFYKFRFSGFKPVTNSVSYVLD